MKKFSILCCAVAMLTVLAGCSSNTTSSETPASSEGTVSSSLASIADAVSSEVSADSVDSAESSDDSSESAAGDSSDDAAQTAEFEPDFPLDTANSGVSSMTTSDTCITVNRFEEDYILQLNFLFADKASAPTTCATVLYPLSDISLEEMHKAEEVPCELSEYIEDVGYYMVYLDPAVVAPGYDTYDGIEDCAEFMVAMCNADYAVNSEDTSGFDTSETYGDDENPSAQGTVSSGDYAISSVSFDTDYAGNDALLIQVTTTAPNTEMSVTDIPRPEIDVDFVLTNSDWVAEVTTGASMMVGTHVVFDYYIEKPGVFETVTVTLGGESQTFAFEDFK